MGGRVNKEWGLVDGSQNASSILSRVTSCRPFYPGNSLLPSAKWGWVLQLRCSWRPKANSVLWAGHSGRPVTAGT